MWKCTAWLSDVGGVWELNPCQSLAGCLLIGCRARASANWRRRWLCRLETASSHANTINSLLVNSGCGERSLYLSLSLCSHETVAIWSLTEEADRTLLLPFLIKTELPVTRKEGLRPLTKYIFVWQIRDVDTHVHLKQTDGEGSYGSAE